MTVSFLALVSNVCEKSLSINSCLQLYNMMNVCFYLEGYIHKAFAGRYVVNISNYSCLLLENEGNKD